MASMKAAVVRRPRGPEALEIEERPIPAPKSGEVLIRVKAFGVNRLDVTTRQGLRAGVKFPRILGIEVVGAVARTNTVMRTANTPSENMLSRSGVALRSIVVPFLLRTRFAAARQKTKCATNVLRLRSRWILPHRRPFAEPNRHPHRARRYEKRHELSDLLRGTVPSDPCLLRKLRGGFDRAAHAPVSPGGTRRLPPAFTTAGTGAYVPADYRLVAVAFLNPPTSVWGFWCCDEQARHGMNQLRVPCCDLAQPTQSARHMKRILTPVDLRHMC
jgi:Alcohol dehydrogenase GroES-like domain